MIFIFRVFIEQINVLQPYFKSIIVHIVLKYWFLVFSSRALLLSAPCGSRQNTLGKDLDCIFCKNKHFDYHASTTTPGVSFIAHNKVVHVVKSKLSFSRGVGASPSWSFWFRAIMLQIKNCNRATKSQQIITVFAVGYTIE